MVTVNHAVSRHLIGDFKIFCAISMLVVISIEVVVMHAQKMSGVICIGQTDSLILNLC